MFTYLEICQQLRQMERLLQHLSSFEELTTGGSRSHYAWLGEKLLSIARFTASPPRAASAATLETVGHRKIFRKQTSSPIHEKGKKRGVVSSIYLRPAFNHS